MFHSSGVSNERDLNGHTTVGVFGGTEIDLIAAPLANGDTRITVVSIFAGTEILVPDDVAIRISGVSIFGSVKVRGRELGGGILHINAYETPGYANALRRLQIDATSIFGGVNIRTP
jgi:predicted membrane protein